MNFARAEVTSNTKSAVMKQTKRMQDIVFDYFDVFTDDTIIAVVTAFVYEQGTNNSIASNSIKQFLIDNSIMQVYLNYVQEKKQQFEKQKEFYSEELDKIDQHLFFRTTLTERAMIEDMKMCFLGLAFNRFKDSHENRNSK